MKNFVAVYKEEEAKFRRSLRTTAGCSTWYIQDFALTVSRMQQRLLHNSNDEVDELTVSESISTGDVVRQPDPQVINSDDVVQSEKRNIYTVDKYANLMAESQKRCRPSVTHMKGKFLKLNQLPATLGLFNNHTNTEGQTVKFRYNIRLIRITTFDSYD